MPVEWNMVGTEKLYSSLGGTGEQVYLHGSQALEKKKKVLKVFQAIQSSYISLCFYRVSSVFLEVSIPHGYSSSRTISPSLIKSFWSGSLIIVCGEVGQLLYYFMWCGVPYLTPP